jgi:hypothetical protein
MLSKLVCVVTEPNSDDAVLVTSEHRRTAWLLAALCRRAILATMGIDADDWEGHVGMYAGEEDRGGVLLVRENASLGFFFEDVALGDPQDAIDVNTVRIAARGEAERWVHAELPKEGTD